MINNINYVWFFFTNFIFTRINQIKKLNINLKDLSKEEILLDYMELQDLILNKSGLEYLDNLIMHTIEQNDKKHQIFFALYNNTDIEKDKYLELNEIIKKLFFKDGKFEKQLNNEFAKINKKNNIKFIHFDQCIDEVLLKLKEKNFLIEEELSLFVSNFLKLKKAMIKSEYLAQRVVGGSLDKFKCLSILYTNIVQNENVIFTDFDTKIKNLNQEFDDKDFIKFCFINPCYYFFFKECKKKHLEVLKMLQNNNFLTTQINSFFVKNKIVSLNEIKNFLNIFNPRLVRHKYRRIAGFSFSHYSLIFVPKSFQNFILYMFMNDNVLCEEKFDELVYFIVENKLDIEYFKNQSYTDFQKIFNLYLSNEKENQSFLIEENEKIQGSENCNILIQNTKNSSKKYPINLIYRLYKKYINHFCDLYYYDKLHIFSLENKKEKQIVIGFEGRTWDKKNSCEKKDENPIDWRRNFVVQDINSILTCKLEEIF